MRIFITLGLAAAAFAGCASLGGRAPAGGVERGQQFAQRACAGCHAIGASGESPRGGAPAFGALRLRYTGPQLERTLAAISGHGHYEMPPIFISADEARDLADYIEGLGGRP
jgi:mono/diheme cytochrome c family protein